MDLIHIASPQDSQYMTYLWYMVFKISIFERYLCSTLFQPSENDIKCPERVTYHTWMLDSRPRGLSSSWPGGMNTSGAEQHRSLVYTPLRTCHSSRRSSWQRGPPLLALGEALQDFDSGWNHRLCKKKNAFKELRGSSIAYLLVSDMSIWKSLLVYTLYSYDLWAWEVRVFIQ